MPSRDAIEAVYYRLYSQGNTTREIALLFRVGKDSVRKDLRNYCKRKGLPWESIRYKHFTRVRDDRLAAISTSKNLPEAASRLSLSPKRLDGWIYMRQSRGDSAPRIEKERWSVRV